MGNPPEFTRDLGDMRLSGIIGREGPGMGSGKGGKWGVKGEPDLVFGVGKGLKPLGPAKRMETGNLGR